MTAVIETTPHRPGVRLDSLQLEITGSCQLTCTHCLNSSSPQGTHGTMTLDDWKQLVTDAAALDIPAIQLIGGEPTTNPGWTSLLDLALSHGRRVEVFSNLFHVRPEWWDVFRRPGVTLATSYYSDIAAEHEAITQRPGSYRRTRNNIAHAVKMGVPLRAGIVHVRPRQRVEAAREELARLGVEHITVDHARAVGRVAVGSLADDPATLCGRCGQGRAAVLPNGDLSLCILSRFMPCGNVREQRLADLLGSERWWQAVELIPAPTGGGCSPDDTSCQPGQPACLPKFPVAGE